MRTYRWLIWLALVTIINSAVQAWSLEFPKPGYHVDLVGALGGSVRALEIKGNVAYLGEGPSLATVDISDRTRPRLLGRTYCGGTIDRIRLSGVWAYLNIKTVGLAIMSLANP